MTDSVIEHYGVKGMRWGVRNERDDSAPSPRASRKIAKQDKKWEKNVDKSYFKVYNAAASAMNNGELDKLNSKPKYKGDLTKNKKLMDEYNTEYARTYNAVLSKASKDILGENASGTKRAEMYYDPDYAFPQMRIVETKVKHDDAVQLLKLIRNKTGHIVKIELDEDLEQSALPSYNDPNWSDEELDAMSTEQFLAHYGVKGMKWGVRKDRESRSEGKTQSFAGLVTKTTATGLAVSGAAAAGRVIGSSLGTTVLGPGVGTMVGGYAGGYVGGRIALKPIAKREEARTKAALSNLSTAVPNRNAKYSDGMLKGDIKLWGVDSAKRINESMNNGMSRKKATSEESSLRFKAGLVSFGAAFATSFAAKTAYSKVNTADLKNKAYNKAYDRNQRRQAATKKADNFGLKPAPTMAKKNRKGVYNVTTMK